MVAMTCSRPERLSEVIEAVASVHLCARVIHMVSSKQWRGHSGMLEAPGELLAATMNSRAHRGVETIDFLLKEPNNSPWGFPGCGRWRWLAGAWPGSTRRPKDGMGGIM